MATKLKIGLILDTSLDPMDGVQQYVVGIGEWLRAQGHEVHYLVGQTEQRQLANIHSLSRNVGVVFNGNRTTIPLPANRRKLRRFIKEQAFDVLHVQTPHHPLMAQHLIGAAGPRTAVVATFHILPYGRLSRWGNKALALWLRPSLKRIDIMLSVSPAAARFEEASFGLPSQVLPNVVDYPRFHDAQPLPQYDDSTTTILFLGRLVPRKGCLLLLKAAAELKKNTELPAFRLVICGTGPMEKQLRAFSEQHDLQKIVTFVGFVEEAIKPRYYASADIAVFPSNGGESFGIVLLEAMASGRAVVLAGNNPGYHSVMEPQPELLFDPTNPAELADKLRTYLLNPALRQQSADWGEAYTAEFDVNTVGRRLEAVYQKALRKRRQP